MFASRKKVPKRVARADVEAQEPEEDSGPVVRRPNLNTKPKSKLRIAFDPADSEEQAEDVQKQTIRVSRPGPSAATQSLPRFNIERDGERPSYNKSYLDELRNSTPSTPKELSVYDPSTPEVSDSLDVAGKFGQSARLTPSSIPSAAEIQEKKERRARLAKEQGSEDFIALEDYDSDGEFKPQRLQVGTYFSRETEKDGRLVRDDEDYAEGFEQFVDDPGRVTMGKKGLREQAIKERQAMKEMIEHAEGSDEDESDSEAERNYAYESAQTHRGMDGLAIHSQQTKEANRPRQPKEVVQILKLATALGRLRETVQSIELEKAKIERRRADMNAERISIKASQNHIQRSLEEAGKELELLQNVTVASNSVGPSQRGLENLGVSNEISE